MEERKLAGRVRLFEIPIDLLERKQLIDRLDEFIENGQSHYIMPVNPIKVVLSLKNQELKRIIENADLVFPDAAGIRWALRALYHIKLRHTPGFELMGDILALASRRGYRVYLLGTKQEVIEKALTILSKRYSGAKFVGYHDGYFNGEDRDKIINLIKATQPHVLFVGMGAFLQEKFIDDTLTQLSIPLCMGVGGSFDVIAGVAPRAPEWACRMGFEWLYRLVRQPKRIRPMIALPEFVGLVLKEKMKKRFIS